VASLPIHGLCENQWLWLTEKCCNAAGSDLSCGYKLWLGSSFLCVAGYLSGLGMKPHHAGLMASQLAEETASGWRKPDGRQS